MSNMEGTGSSPDTVKAEHGASPSAPSTSEQPTSQRKAGKRDRVALACQRCKTRKQKCDGARPGCSSCTRLSLKCVYIVPLVPAAGEKKQYIKALEQRVAELESALASLGHMGAGTDHFGGGIVPTPISSQQFMTGSHGSLPTRQEADDDGNDILIAVRDMSLSASGHYVGASSNISIGRVLSSVVHQGNPSAAATDGPTGQDEDDPAPKSVYSTEAGEMLGVPFMTPSVAQRLLEGWFRHIATRYPVLHSAKVMVLHENRDNLAHPYENGILHLVYAVSGRWLESAGEMGHFFSDHHYTFATRYMDDILSLRDSRTVDYLLLMALYCTRAPRDPGAWTYVGAAMRLCIELGLHRRTRRQLPSVEAEMNKRRFWTAYFLDRDISIAIGRPPCISDHDIDTDLPLDINEDTSNDEYIRQASLHVRNLPMNPPNSLTSFIHRLRLKRLESEIQHVVYRVDNPNKTPNAVIQAFLDRLNTWKDAIPYNARTFVNKPNIAFEGLEFYTIHYHRCVRFLLYPQLDETPVNTQYLKLCADACSGIIADYRRVHQVFPVGFSALSIQSVFLAGLTLIYCAWLAPMNFIDVNGPLTDCQLLLYIVTERYPSARKYRDVFERIKQTIMNLVAQGKHQPRGPVNLEPNVQDGFANFPVQWAQGMGADFSYMINTMTGNTSTPPNTFVMGMDPTAISMSGDPAQQPDMSQYQAWSGLPHISSNINGMDAMGGMFQ